MKRELPEVAALLDFSKLSLSEYWRKQLNDAANTRKDVNRLLADWIEAMAHAMLAEWLAKNGELLVELAAARVDERAEILARLSIPAPEKLPQLVKSTQTELTGLFRPPRRVVSYTGGQRKVAKA